MVKTRKNQIDSLCWIQIAACACPFLSLPLESSCILSPRRIPWHCVSMCHLKIKVIALLRRSQQRWSHAGPLRQCSSDVSTFFMVAVTFYGIVSSLRRNGSEAGAFKACGSSFGFGGVNAHVVLEALQARSCEGNSTKRKSYERVAVSYREKSSYLFARFTLFDFNCHQKKLKVTPKVIQIVQKGHSLTSGSCEGEPEFSL